jgi:hypothetical protein
MRWADYEKEMPPGFSSADNGAIHLHLVRTLGMEPLEGGACAQLYYNLTALVTNLGEYNDLAKRVCINYVEFLIGAHDELLVTYVTDPYYEFVGCTRQLVQAGTYRSADSSALSIRIMKKQTAWVMDAFVDGYGKEGHGPGGVGPVFPHGVKLHGNKEDVKIFDKYGFDFVEVEDTCKPIADQARCSSQANEELGVLSTPGACAKVASNDKSCGDTFMFSKSYPSWGCRCFVADDSPNHSGEELWAVYSASACVIKD